MAQENQTFDPDEVIADDDAGDTAPPRSDRLPRRTSDWKGNPLRPTAREPHPRDPYNTVRAETMRAESLALLGGEAVRASAKLLNRDGFGRNQTGYAGIFEHNCYTHAAARSYAAAGLKVIDSHALQHDGKPTGVGGGVKLPRGSGWPDEASTDPIKIDARWTGKGKYPESKDGTAYPYARATSPRNVSIVTGGGIVCLDVDPPLGMQSLGALEAEHGPLPETVEQRTGSGGRQFLFRVPPGVKVRNSAGAVAQNIDVRGEGGQMMCAPSVHPSGNFYAWKPGRAPGQIDIAEAPEWLVKLMQGASKSATAGTPRHRGAGRQSVSPGAVAQPDVSGFEDLLETIGDGDGRGGFNTPIFRAMCSWFGRHGADASPEDVVEMKEQVRAAIRAAPVKAGRDVEDRYATDSHLDDEIESARAFIAACDAADDEGEDLAADDPDVAPRLTDPVFNANLIKDGFVVGEASKMHANVETIRRQMRESMRTRYSFVLAEGGDARVVLRPARGDAPRVLRKDGLRDAYANRAVRYFVTEKRTAVLHPAAEFFADPLRPTYSGTEFEPDPAKEDPDLYNLWTGFRVAPEAGDWSLLRGHIRDQMIGGNGADEGEDDRLFAWFMTWLSDLFQHPGRKAGSAVAFLGEQGTGKSKLGDWLRLAIGAAAVKIASRKHLVGSFNAHLDAKILAVAEEAFWSGDKEAGGALKDLITAERFMVERKGVDAVERANYLRFMFNSNEAWVVPTDDNSDSRRFFVARVNNHRKQDSAFFASIDAQMEAGGLAAMAHELMHWNPADHGLAWGDLRSPPWTAAKGEQATYSLSGPRARLLAIIEAGTLSGRAKDGSPFAYDLSDDFETEVLREHLVADLTGHRDSHGGVGKSVADAITSILGPDADQGDSKRTIKFDTTPDSIGIPGLGEKRGRWVQIPPLAEVRARLATIYT